MELVSYEPKSHSVVYIATTNLIKVCRVTSGKRKPTNDFKRSVERKHKAQTEKYRLTSHHQKSESDKCVHTQPGLDTSHLNLRIQCLGFCVVD
jgi:hypothetical protein